MNVFVDQKSHPCRVSILPRLVVLIQYTQEEKLARIMSRSKNRERKAESKLEKIILKTMHMMSLGEDCLFFFQIVAQGKAQCSSPFYRDVACVLDITSFYLPKLGLYITSSHSSPTRVVLKHPQRLGVFLRKMMAWTLKRLPPSLLEAPMDRRPRDLSLTTVWDHGTVDGLGWGLAALKKGTAPTSQPKKPKSLKIC